MLNAVYTLLLYLLLPALLLRMAFRGIRNHAYLRRWHERFGFAATAPSPHFAWVHAVSVGEVNAAAPLIRELIRHYPGKRLIVTTMTPTGSAQAQRLFGDSVSHSYVPWDYPPAVSRFLQRVRPALAIIMETEIWPNLLRTCHRRSVPVTFANVRLSHRSFRGYSRIRPLFRRPLEQVAAFAVQAAPDAGRMRRLGARPETVFVTGSIKFEVALPANLESNAIRLRGQWGESRPVVVAGSTHAGEEEVILNAYDTLKRRYPTLLLVLVPRHPERFDTVARYVRKAGYRLTRRSASQEPVPAEWEVVLGDTMGELLTFYAAGDIAVIGGSFVRIGGHNLLEACAVAKPVVFGPHMFNFTEISAITIDQGAGVQVQDSAELADTLDLYLGDAAARVRSGQAGLRMVEENRGALEHTLRVLQPFLRTAAQRVD